MNDCGSVVFLKMSTVITVIHRIALWLLFFTANHGPPLHPRVACGTDLLVCVDTDT